MRLRIAAALLAACSVVLGQAQSLSVEKLVAFVQSSVKLIAEGKMTDRELANFLSRTKVTERLTEGIVEDLQGLGVGPKTLEALNKLKEQSQNLTEAAPIEAKPVPKPIPPPSSEEQAAIIDEVREYARSYTKNLPDFICTQVTRRFAARRPASRGGLPPAQPSWQSLDTLTIRLSFFNQKEDYKLILVNSSPVSSDYGNVGGSTSYGDFGSMMKEIFAPATRARFEWDHWGTLRGQRVMAFAYTVEQARSTWHITARDAGMDIVPGYHGLVEVDKDTHAILRITFAADGIPPDFPIKKAESVLDYDFTDISGRTFLLPLKGEVSMDMSDYMTRNILEFRLYRKYSAESDIKYDEAPEPLPEEKTKETPDPAAPPKK